MDGDSTRRKTPQGFAQNHKQDAAAGLDLFVMGIKTRWTGQRTGRHIWRIAPSAPLPMG